MPRLHASAEFAGTHAEERDAVAVLRIHIGLNFEDKSAEFFFGGRNRTAAGRARLRPRCGIDKPIEQLLHAKIIHRRTEIHRR